MSPIATVVFTNPDTRIKSFVVTDPVESRISSFVFLSRGPAGKNGTLTDNVVMAETPSGSINGINTVFTAAFDFDQIWVYWNGLRMKPVADFDVTGLNQFQLTSAPQSGDSILIDYVKTS